MRALGYVLAGSVGTILAFVAARHIGVVTPSRLVPSRSSFTLDLAYTDFLTVMFAGATLVLAAVALVVGLVAIFTYQGIKGEARRTLRKTVDEQVNTIKVEARNTIQTAVDEQLGLIEARIEREVSEEAEEKLARAIEKAGQSGALDRALERALIAIGSGGPRLAKELDFDAADEEER